MEQCTICGREFKNVGVHMRMVHEAGNSSSVQPVAQAAAPSPKIHKFISSRSPGLMVVIRPTRQGFVTGPGGVQMNTMLKGKSVQFVKGMFETSDQETIDFLTSNKNSEFASTWESEAGYVDRRYPITDITDVGNN